MYVREKAHLQDCVRIHLINCASMKDLWNHERHFKTKPLVNPIEPSQLYDHFSDLLNKSKQDIDNHFSEYVTEILRNHNFSVCKLCQKSPFNEAIKKSVIENAINNNSSDLMVWSERFISVLKMKFCHI